MLRRQVQGYAANLTVNVQLGPNDFVVLLDLDLKFLPAQQLGCLYRLRVGWADRRHEAADHVETRRQVRRVQ